MSKIGLFYGTQTGNTEQIAFMIQEEIGKDMVDIHDMSDVKVGDFADYQHLIIGVPTWNDGELSSDWEAFSPELDDIDFNGKTVAYFGVGDQTGYPDTFMDAIGILEAKISSLGGKTVCPWSTDGYDFEVSKGVRDGKFIGLALDENNQGDLTESRIKTWTGQVKQAFSISISPNPQLKAEQPIAYVGDRINDAPALTETDLGLAIGAGTNNDV